jgi:hypothetical protein
MPRDDDERGSTMSKQKEVGNSKEWKKKLSNR